MKKLTVLMLSAFMIFSSSSTVFAETMSVNKAAQEVTILKNEEIKDLRELYQRALSDSTNQKKINKVAKIADNKVGIEQSLDSISTTQLLEVKENKKNKEITEIYATTTIVNVLTSEDPLTGNMEIFSSGSGSNNADKWDNSSSVKAYSTVYWTKSDINGYEHVTITEIQGGWNRSDTSVSMSGRTLKVGQNGSYTPSGSSHHYINDQISTTYPGSDTYAWYTPSSWKPVRTANAVIGSIVGTTSTVSLKRGSSTWTLTFTNNVIG